MKKIISIIVGIGVVVLLSLPVFADDSLEERVAELEKRVEALETLLGAETTDEVSESDANKEGVLSGVYSPDFFTGYKFSDDGTVIFYDAKWYKVKEKPTGCKPEYQYGTYKLDGSALTIKISGQNEEITGVISDDMIVIGGEECEPVTESYAYDYEKTAELYSEEAVKAYVNEWNKLNEVLGLDIVEYKE